MELKNVNYVKVLVNHVKVLFQKTVLIVLKIILDKTTYV